MAQSELIAKAFHEAYERLAPSFSYQTREASRTEWESVPEQNKKLMIAVVSELLKNKVIKSMGVEDQNG